MASAKLEDEAAARTTLLEKGDDTGKWPEPNYLKKKQKKEEIKKCTDKRGGKGGGAISGRLLAARLRNQGA